MTAERELQRLIRLFEQAEEGIAKEMLKAEARGADYTATQKRAKRAEIRTVLTELTELALGGNPDEETGPVWNVVREAYREGAASAEGDLERLGRGEIKRGFTQTHQDAARVIYENLRDRLADAVGYVGRRADDVFRRIALGEVLKSMIEGRGSKESAQNIEVALKRRGVGAFRDSRGREWNLKNYAEMVARTTASEASSMGTLNRLAENGMDLVRIVVAADACDECKRRKDKVYSIASLGTHRRYPRLEEVPPFHPRCTCRISGYIEGLSEVNPNDVLLGET